MGTTHNEPHPQAGETVTIQSGHFAGEEYWIEDWWDHLTGGSWGDADGNPACIKYAIRAGAAGLPTDDEVVYGKIGPFGELIHASELAPTE
jgi:hypothetical protein